MRRALARLSVGIIGLAGALMVEAKTAPTAQAARFACGFCWYNIGSNLHSFGSMGSIYDCYPNSCHVNLGQPGQCKDWHCDCGIHCVNLGSEGASATPVTPEVKALATALTNGDAKAIEGLLAKNTDLNYNVDRKAIQVTGCNGTVEYSFPVDGIKISAP
jgi:hypothetical protein